MLSYKEIIEKIKDIFTDTEIREIANDENLLKELFENLGE
jgi:hypothetical protein